MKPVWLKTRAALVFLQATVYMAAAILSMCVASCGTGEFDPANMIQSVRVLAVRADKPFAAPGDTVNLEMLAVDGRKDRTRPMRTFWFPLVCENPKEDLYYLCFEELFKAVGGAPGDADAGANALLGKDASRLLVESSKFSFGVKSDLIASHPIVPGAPKEYGLAIVFYFACAGHPEFVIADQKSLQQPPIACFDETGKRLGPDDYVIGFTRIYAYEGVTNQNPEFGAIRFEEVDVDRVSGITIPTCNEDDVANCEKKKLRVEATEASQELNPVDRDKDGNPLREQVWVSFFTTVGRFDGGQRLLYDATSGRVTNKQDIDLIGPNKPEMPRDGRIYLVLHDNRGGVAWTDFPLVAR